MVDEIETFLLQLVQLALQWDPQGANEATSSNTVERLLLIMAQLSSQFAVQYYWMLQSLLQELQPEKNARLNAAFDMKAYGACMRCSGNLERCFRGNRRKEAIAPIVPKLKLVTTFGGAVTTFEKLVIGKQAETNREFFGAILILAEENATQRDQAECGTVSHLKQVFGGVLLFKRHLRKAGRRKQWKERYFSIEESMLNCYSRERTLLRSITLEGATIWKVPQDRYPHSFIVGDEDGTMYHLRASSEEQKSLWKRKLREVIQQATSSPSFDCLPVSQRERYNTFQQAKWLGRTLIKTTLALDGTPPESRSERLHEILFEMEVPKDVYWRWQDSAMSTAAPENQAFVVLPHFSHLMADTNATKTTPLFKASFMLRQKQDEQSVKRDASFVTFLMEGQEVKPLRSDGLPLRLRQILRDNQTRSRATGAHIKDRDGGSTTGDSTGYAYTESDSEEGSVSGPSVSDCNPGCQEGVSEGIRSLPNMAKQVSAMTKHADEKAHDTTSEHAPARQDDCPFPKMSAFHRVESMENNPIELVLKADYPERNSLLDKVKRRARYTLTNPKNPVALVLNLPSDHQQHHQEELVAVEEIRKEESPKRGSTSGLANMLTSLRLPHYRAKEQLVLNLPKESPASDVKNLDQEESSNMDSLPKSFLFHSVNSPPSWQLVRSQTMEKNPIELVLNLPEEHPLSDGKASAPEELNKTDPPPRHYVHDKANVPISRNLQAQPIETKSTDRFLNLPQEHPCDVGKERVNEKPNKAKSRNVLDKFSFPRMQRSQTLEKNPIELVLDLPEGHPLSDGKELVHDKANPTLDEPTETNQHTEGTILEQFSLPTPYGLLHTQTMEKTPIELVLNLPRGHPLFREEDLVPDDPVNANTPLKEHDKANKSSKGSTLDKVCMPTSWRQLSFHTMDKNPIELVTNLPKQHPLPDGKKPTLDELDKDSLSQPDSLLDKLRLPKPWNMTRSQTIETNPIELVLNLPEEHPLSAIKTPDPVFTAWCEQSADVSSIKAEAAKPKENQVQVAGTNTTMFSETTNRIVAVRTKQYQWQEMLAAQLAQYCKSMLSKNKIWIQSPQLQPLKWDIALAVLPRHAVSVADAKTSSKSLLEYFVAKYGPVDSKIFEFAQLCFVRSLAGMFLLCFLLGLQNQDDGNLMLDEQGHIFASDFSSAFGRIPNNRIGPAMSSTDHPFKFPEEYIDLMGGSTSRSYETFAALLVSGLVTIRENATVLVQMIRIAGGKHVNGRLVDRIVRQFEKKVNFTASSTPKKISALIAKGKKAATSSASTDSVRV
jgi:Phosphatidylinositol 3- and 4-kinase/PH domain